MRRLFGVLCVGFLTSAGAAPFLKTPSSSRAALEQKFLQTPFCKALSCQIRPIEPFYGHSVFKLSNGLEVQLDVWYASGLHFNLEPKKPLSLETIRTLKALIRVAMGQDLTFDFAKNCTSIAQIQKAKPLDFYLKPLGRWGTVSCLEDTTGIPQGEENTAPEFIPTYRFSIVLPV